MSLTYVTVIIYVIFLSKLNASFAHHVHNRNPIQFWLKYEIVAFFSWITAIALFIFIMFVFRLKSILKHEREKFNIENIWMSKNATDFLRYYNFESERFSDLAYQIILVMWYYIDGHVVSSVGL